MNSGEIHIIWKVIYTIWVSQIFFLVKYTNLVLKMFRHQTTSQGCLNCAVGNLLKFTAYFGLPYILTCDHEKAKTTTKFSKFHFIVAIVGITIVSFANYYCIKRINNEMQKNYVKYDLLLMTSDFVFYGISIILSIHFLCNSRKAVYFLHFMENFMMEFEKSTSCCLFSMADALGFRTRIYIYLILLSMANASAAVFLFCFDVEPNWNTIERAGLFICMYVGTFSIVTGMIFSRILFRVGDKFRKLLKIDLENLINYRNTPNTEEIVNDNNLHISQCDTKNLLKTYSEAYLSFICAFKQMNNRCNPVLLILILVGIIFFVITIFMIILLLENGYSISARFVSVQIGMQFALVAMAACFIHISKCGVVHEEILTYLYKFPIHKLELSERLQFESFLLIVKRLKMKMQASQIVQIDMPLFASILSTVLTYVLVAVQFEFL